jgi:hypothetical protein
MTPSGIDPATFRFVGQSLNHCATATYRGSTKKSNPNAVNNVCVNPLNTNGRLLKFQHPFRTAQYTLFNSVVKTNHVVMRMAEASVCPQINAKLGR